MKQPVNADTPVESDTYFPSELLLAHLDTTLQKNDEPAFMSELRRMVKAHGGFATVAQETGINRTALYNVLSARHDPKLSTLMRLLPALGLRLSLKRLGVGKQGPLKGGGQRYSRP